MTPEQANLFDHCCTTELLDDGRVTIKCNKGHWAIVQWDMALAEMDARRYFETYLGEGAYADIIRSLWRDGLGMDKEGAE
jgi:hypothetical protein